MYIFIFIFIVVHRIKLEDFNALKNTSIGYRIKKLEGFEVVFVGDLKPTPISNVYRVYIVMIKIYI